MARDHIENPPEKYKDILKWFVDHPHQECFYSIHNIAKFGTLFDKKIGEWFGPLTISNVLQLASLSLPLSLSLFFFSPPS